MYAEMRIEQDLVKGRLLQQLQISQEKYGEQAVYTANPGIKIYRYDSAPENLKTIANGTVQEMRVTVNNKAGKTCAVDRLKLSLIPNKFGAIRVLYFVLYCLL